MLELARPTALGARRPPLQRLHAAPSHRGDAGYRKLLQRASLNLADGKSVAWMNKLRPSSSTAPTASVVTTSSSTWSTRARPRRPTLPARQHPGGVAQLRAELAAPIPEAQIVGVESPPSGLSPTRACGQAARIRKRGRHRLGRPWHPQAGPRRGGARCASRSRCGRDRRRLRLHLGRNKPEAPRWMQESGIEWMHRFASEPRRLWKRYLVWATRVSSTRRTPLPSLLARTRPSVV